VASAAAIKIGTWISNTASVGYVLTATNNAAIAAYCDDGGAAITSSITTPVFARYLVTVDQTSGATQTALHAQLKVAGLGAGGGTRAFSAGGLRGAYIFNQLGTVTLSGNAEMVGINQATTLGGVMTVGATNIWGGVDVNIAGAGTASVTTGGLAAGVIVRSKTAEAALWPIGVLVPAGGAGIGLQIGTSQSSSAATGHHLLAAGPRAISVFADDNAAVLGSDVQGINARCVFLSAQTAGYACSAVRGHLRFPGHNVQNSEQKAWAGVSGYIEASGTYTIGDGTNGVFLCALDGACELGDTPTVAAGSKVVGLHLYGKFTAASYTGETLAIMVESGGTAGFEHLLGFHDGVFGMVTTASHSTNTTHKVAVWINGIGTRYIRMESD
jgi:hypothetical protein